jgi:GT2 family glycosyltransferase
MTIDLVSVVIVNYRKYEYLRHCLTSVNSSRYSNIEIIVVDNDSDEMELENIRKDFNHIKFYPMKVNLNYAEGNNFGISKSSGVFIAILNNDTMVEEQWLDPLLKAASINPDAIYQPKILFLEKPDTVLSLGNTVHVLGFAFPLGIGKKILEIDLSSELQEIFYCSGTCLFASKSIFSKLNGFDSNYWTFYEDVNLGWRARLLGLSCYLVPSSTIYHNWGGTYGQELTNKKFYLIERGRVSSILRNYSLKSIIILFPFLLLVDIFMFIYFLRRKGMAKAKFMAFLDLIKNMRSLLRQRAKIQQTRVASDSEISKMFNTYIEHPYVQNIPELSKKILVAISKMLIKRL